MAADSAFPGVRLHVVTARPPEASPMADKSGDLAMARRAKTVEDLRALDDSAERTATGNVQFSPSGDDARAAPQRERSEPQERAASKEKKEKKDKKDKERSKERDEKKERRAAKVNEQDAELLEQERQRKRLEVKPRPSRQMSVSVVTSLTSDYVGRHPRQSQPPSQQQASRASGMPPSLPAQRTRPAPSAANGASSSRAVSNADELSPPPGQSTSSGPRGRFFGRPMEELSTPSKEGQAAPASLFSTRTSLGHVPAILYALAEIVYKRGVKGSIHGLFRISGRAPRIAELRAALDSLPAGELRAQVERLVDTEDIHVVTGLFKLLLREQPEPLVPSSFRCLTDSGEQEDRLLQGRTLVSLMTAKHRASFFYVFELLARVRDEKELRMSSTALGVVFGPVVMRVNETDLAQFHIASAVVEAIIDHFLALTVPTPSSLLSPRGSRIRMAALDQSRGRTSHSQSPPPRVDSADAIARPRQGGSGGLFGSASAESAAADVAKWTPAEVGQWVAQLGLAAYAPAFREHQVDGQALLELDRFDLQDMGVRLVGHQKTILRNVRTLVTAD